MSAGRRKRVGETGGGAMARRRRRPGQRAGRRTPKKVDASDAYAEDAARLAEQLRREAKARWGTVLGSDLDAVRTLDRVLRFVRDEGVKTLVLPAGFFFGELLRRHYGGRYAWSPVRKALGLELDGLIVYPLETVRRIVADPQARPLEHVLMILAKRLSEQRAGRARREDGR